MAACEEGDTRHPRATYGCRDVVSPHRFDEATNDLNDGRQRRAQACLQGWDG
jgi:hypothetical protein